MDDQTQIITREPNADEPVAKADSSHLLNMSGRAWIAIIFALGCVVICTAGLFLKNLDATIFGLVLSGFLPLAGNIIGIYMGQNMKPKTQQ